MSATEELLARHEQARVFAMEEAVTVANAIMLAMSEVRNPRAFVAVDFVDLVAKVTRLGELQASVIRENRAIRELHDKALREVGR